jgi:large subunit ribosomal protein L31e
MEREYVIPLRREFQKAPRYKKASKSIRAIKEFIKKHMKTEKVVLGKYLNEEIWKNGPKNPPSKVSVKAIKEEDKVKVELLGAPEEIKEEVKEKKKSTKEKPQEKTTETPTKEEPTPKETTKPKESKEDKIKPKKEEKVPKAKDLVKKKEPIKKVPKTSELKKNSKNQKD